MAHRQIIAKAALDGATSVMGQSLPKWNVRVTSAFPLIATEERTSRDVSNVPVTGSCSAANRVVIRSPPRRARTPAGRRYCIWDSELAGFGLRVERAARRRSKQLKPPDGGVFLRLNGIVIKSHRGFGTE